MYLTKSFHADSLLFCSLENDWCVDPCLRDRFLTNILNWAVRIVLFYNNYWMKCFHLTRTHWAINKSRSTRQLDPNFDNLVNFVPSVPVSLTFVFLRTILLRQLNCDFWQLGNQLLWLHLYFDNAHWVLSDREHAEACFFLVVIFCKNFALILTEIFLQFYATWSMKSVTIRRRGFQCIKLYTRVDLMIFNDFVGLPPLPTVWFRSGIVPSC